MDGAYPAGAGGGAPELGPAGNECAAQAESPHRSRVIGLLVRYPFKVASAVEARPPHRSSESPPLTPPPGPDLSRGEGLSARTPSMLAAMRKKKCRRIEPSKAIRKKHREKQRISLARSTGRDSHAKDCIHWPCHPGAHRNCTAGACGRSIDQLRHRRDRRRGATDKC